MVQQTQMSPAIVSAMFSMVKTGQLKQAAVRKLIQADQEYTLGDMGAKYSKNRDGNTGFTVFLSKNGQQVGNEPVGDRVEAQLTIIEYLTKATQPA